MEEAVIKVGISIGDINGIGGEIILKTFEDPRMLELCTPVIFANSKLISFLSKRLGYTLKFQGVKEASNVLPGKINVVNISNENVPVNFGEMTQEAGKYAIKSLRTAVSALKNGDVDVLVTAPINKANIQDDDFKFPGHTDFLNQELDGDSLMFMITDDLRIGLLTDHVPVKDAPSHITPALIQTKFNTIYTSLVQDFGIQKPKVAFLGINPHVGDNGIIGKEDDEVLIPTLEKLRQEGKIAYGPYAADSFFGSGNYKNFDAIIAAYHDQGLIPFKTLSFGNGVNYTAGLSHVRTSPDHGTAYEIAGKNVADANSFKEAVFKAIDIYRKRDEYSLLTQNVLRKQRPARPSAQRNTRDKSNNSKNLAS